MEGPTAEACLWTEGTLSFVDLLVSTTYLTMGTKAVTKKKRYKGNVSNKKGGGGKYRQRRHKLNLIFEIRYFFSITHQRTHVAKVPYFFISPAKFNFYHFLPNSSE